MTSILYVTHGALLLIFGVFVTSSFAGINVRSRRNFGILIILCMVIGMLQFGTWSAVGDSAMWDFYPLITHLPLAIFLCLFYHKRLETVLASVFTAYMFCQPVKWFGVIAQYFTGSEFIEYVVRIAVILVSAYPIIRFISPFLSRIYNRERRSVVILALMPMIYYVFDYVTIVYTDLWINNNRIVAEFVPLMLVFVYLTVTIMYSNELEAKMYAEQKASIIKIADDQQQKEIETMRRNQNEIRVMHHDMRLFMNTLSLCIERGDIGRAKDLLTSYGARLDETRTKRYCSIDVINYILSDFDVKCRDAKVKFVPRIKLGNVTTDINSFLPILTNALDNALEAQKLIAEDERWIELRIQTSDGRLLMAVENPVDKAPRFEDGIPVSTRSGEGHGYGTKSISYMTDHLGGKVKFSVDDNIFSVKVII